MQNFASSWPADDVSFSAFHFLQKNPTEKYLILPMIFSDEKAGIVVFDCSEDYSNGERLDSSNYLRSAILVLDLPEATDDACYNEVDICLNSGTSGTAHANGRPWLPFYPDPNKQIVALNLFMYALSTGRRTFTHFIPAGVILSRLPGPRDYPSMKSSEVAMNQSLLALPKIPWDHWASETLLTAPRVRDRVPLFVSCGPRFVYIGNGLEVVLYSFDSVPSMMRDFFRGDRHNLYAFKIKPSIVDEPRIWKDKVITSAPVRVIHTGIVLEDHERISINEDFLLVWCKKGYAIVPLLYELAD